MNLEFTEDQQALRASAREVLATESPPSVVREAVDDPERWRRLWKTVAELGWPALCLPAEAGGLDGGAVSLVALLEAAGAALLPAPLTSTLGWAAPLLVAGGAAPDLLAEVADGAVATAALHQADGAPDGPPVTRMDGGRLRGRSALVPDATRAAVFVTVVEASGRPAAAVVHAGAGVEVTPSPSVDPSRPLADVVFDVAGDDVTVLDGGLDRGLDTVRTAAAAELVGVGDRALEVTVQHVRTREQFGQPIGAFQAVKHRLADAYVDTERARTLTYRSAMLLDDPDATATERSVAAALAKAAASEAAVGVAKTAVQLHGALGVTWEHDAHLFLRRARQGALLLGDARHHYRRAALLHLSRTR